MFMQLLNAELTVQSSHTITAKPLPFFFSKVFLKLLVAMVKAPEKCHKDLYTITEIRVLMIQPTSVHSLKEIVTLRNKQYIIV